MFPQLIEAIVASAPFSEASCFRCVIHHDDFCMTLQEEYSSENYGRPMWYKNANAVGIRRKKPGDIKQIFAFGGKHSPLDKDAMMQLGFECLKKLDGGMAEADVKDWVVKMAK